MDEIVRKALAKWPNVPHCYGWLALDARGAFRMRDDAAQAAHAAGDVIRHPALLSFIYRNYACDERGAWYFQNGPQRVYVELDATPFIARTDPEFEFVTQDGQPMGAIGKVWMTDEGRLLLQSAAQDAQKLAMLDDRDLAQCLSRLRIDGHLINDDAQLLAWLDKPQRRLQWQLGEGLLEVEWLAAQTMEQRFGYVSRPGEALK